MQELHISVRNLVEFIFRAGDIDNRAGKLASAEAMMEGSRIHRKIQKSMDTSYQAEVPLKIEWKANDYVLVVEGRADGIVYGKFQPDLPAATESVLQPEMEFAAEIPPEEEISFIDEIKGVYRNVAAMEQPVYVQKTCRYRSTGNSSCSPGNVLCVYLCETEPSGADRRADDLLQSGYGRNSVFPGNFRL